jgi:hypothetical protein
VRWRGCVLVFRKTLDTSPPCSPVPVRSWSLLFYHVLANGTAGKGLDQQDFEVVVGRLQVLERHSFQRIRPWGRERMRDCMADTKVDGKNNNTHLRITDDDWNAMADRRDKLDEDIEDAFARKSLRMAAIAINERAHLSAALKKAHNMRERDHLAHYRKRLEELKDELEKQGIATTETEEDEGVA